MAEATRRHGPKCATSPTQKMDVLRTPPLSWHLTNFEKRCIQNAWNNISGNAEAEVEAFLKSETGYFPASGCSCQRRTID